jgi:hypothetical protein
VSAKGHASLWHRATFPAGVGAALGLAVLGCVFAESWATVGNEETTLRMDMETLELSTIDDGSNRNQLSFTLEGSEPQSVRLDVLDVALLEDGSKTLLPLAATDHTLNGVVTLSESTFAYVPNGESQTFTVDVVATGSLENLAWGAVRVSMSPSDSGDESLSSRSTSGIVRFVIVTPDGWEGGFPVTGAPGLEVGTMIVVSGARPNIIEQVLPDIPGVVNRGPLVARLPMSNTSAAPGFVVTEWTFTSGGDVLLERPSDRRLLLPTEVFEHQVDSMVQAPGSTRLIDVSPGFGRVVVASDTTVSLAGREWAVHDQSQSVLMLRWKEPFALFVLVGVIVGLLIWGRRKDFAASQEERTASWVERVLRR